MSTETVRYRARASDAGLSPWCPMIGAGSLLDAAVMFAERWVTDTDEISVAVIDEETGERSCFRIDLQTGDAQAC